VLGPDYSPPGRHIRSHAGLWPSGPVYQRLKPGWAGTTASRLGRPSSFPAGPVSLLLAGPVFQHPGWAGASSSRRGPDSLLRPAPFPGWASAPRPPSAPRLGLEPANPAGPLGRPIPGHHLQRPRLGRIRRIWPGRDSFPGPPSAMSRLGQAGIPLAQAGILFTRPDYISSGRINPLWAEIHLIRDIFLIRHRLQRLVPVLGRLQAQTGTSSIVVCWSWDAPWLRRAYSTSPSQSYPQEEDKTDGMEILKTHARRRRPSTPRTDIDGTSP
jgi:hypothetical protein